jgi:transcription antitermination factor NusG
MVFYDHPTMNDQRAHLGCAWHALHTRYQHEKAIAETLSNKGFEIFLPLRTVAHRWKDRTKELSLPLFPCYVFLRGGLDRRLQILTTPGVHRFVGSGGYPAPIPEVEIEGVRRVLDTRLPFEPHPFLKCGDWVRIKSGALEGLEGILVRKKNLFRLVLSVELLEKSVAVEVEASLVERVRKRNAGKTSPSDGDGESENEFVTREARTCLV